MVIRRTDPEAILTEKDIEKIRIIHKCIYDLILTEKGKELIFKNKTLDSFVAGFLYMLEDIKESKHIADWISAYNKMEISVPVVFEE